MNVNPSKSISKDQSYARLDLMNIRSCIETADKMPAPFLHFALVFVLGTFGSKIARLLHGFPRSSEIEIKSSIVSGRDPRVEFFLRFAVIFLRSPVMVISQIRTTDKLLS